jgi:hypothetical protein
MENLIDILITANSTKPAIDPYEEVLLDWWENNFFNDDSIAELYVEETSRR